VFVLDAAYHSAVQSPDVIWDFDASAGDKLDLTGAFGGPFLGNLVPPILSDGFRFIESKQFSGNGKELRIRYNVDGSFLLRGDVDADGSADFKIVVNGHPHQTINNSAFVTRRLTR